MPNVKIHRGDIVNIVCNVSKIGYWSDLLIDRGYTVISIAYVDTTNQVAENTWNIIGEKKLTVCEDWQ